MRFEKNRKKFKTWFDKSKKRVILKAISPMSGGWLKTQRFKKSWKKFKTWFDKSIICDILIEPSRISGEVVWKLNSAM